MGPAPCQSEEMVPPRVGNPASRERGGPPNVVGVAAATAADQPPAQNVSNAAADAQQQ